MDSSDAKTQTAGDGMKNLAKAIPIMFPNTDLIPATLD